jgi:pyrroline-5-carboxylate reductase
MTLDLNGTLLLVGCGKMGGALLAGWLEQGVDPMQVIVVEPALDPSRISIPQGVQVVVNADEISGDVVPSVILLAVKPQAMGDVVPAYAKYAASGAVYLSIAAGTPISFFQNQFGDTAHIVRVMPNTPAAVGQGMSVLCANGNVSPVQKKLCGALLEAVGQTAWLEDENLMDAVTAVSGSGPAYVFLLIESLAEAGRKVGLPDSLAQQLALQTVAGSGELARQSEEAPAQLRINVTSPGGTTAAALDVLMANNGLQPIMDAAVAAAERRGKELGAS